MRARLYSDEGLAVLTFSRGIGHNDGVSAIAYRERSVWQKAW